MTRRLRMFKGQGGVQQVERYQRLRNKSRLAEYIGEDDTSPRLDTQVFCRPRCKLIASEGAVGAYIAANVAARRAHVAATSTMCTYETRQQRDVQNANNGGEYRGADV